MRLHDEVRRKFRFMGRTDNVPWSPPTSRAKPNSRAKLAELFGEMGLNKGVEVGARMGAYSTALCIANPKLHLTCVDPWEAYGRVTQEKQDDYFARFQENVAKYNITILRKRSMDALADFADESLDLVYIDGNHLFDFVAPDIIYWSNKVKSGGVVAVHDYYHFHMAGVVHAVDGYTRSHHIDPWYVTRDNEPTAYWQKP